MGRNLRQVLAAWWTDTPDRWLLEFLESRRVLVWVKVVIAAGVAAAAVMVALGTCTPHFPQHLLARLVAGLLVVMALGWALRWLLGPWPTPAQSLWFVATADVAITMACWLDTERLIGLDGTSTFLLPGIYVMFFHGPKAQAAHVGWAVFTTLTLVIAVGGSPVPGAWALAAARALLCLTVSVWPLPVLQLGFWLVRQNSVDSLIDPLTGLVNRRGLDYRLGRPPASVGEGIVCVFAVDLDGFKNVNDRYGHPTGDHVLKQTAARIQATMGPGAVIARTGGEEFVAIDLLEPPSAPVVAERLRHAIAAATDPPVTASIGVAVTATHDLPSSHEIIPLLAYADAVMYHAKHQGGNTITVHSFTACADVMGDPEGKPHK